MIITSDWHIHSNFSYDSELPLSEIEENSLQFGFKKFGITDHVNFNDTSFTKDLEASAKGVSEFKKSCNRAVLGVELTPIAKPEFDYIAKHGTKNGYIPKAIDLPYEIELAKTKEELKALGVQYCVGASHWRVDVPHGQDIKEELNACIKEWHRQQMWLACDERVTILGHPWYNGSALWYEDFSVIPRIHINELSAALLENGKYCECNAHFFVTKKSSEKFKNQYAEFIRELFEMGIPITYGSDSHYTYDPDHITVEKYLLKAGFKAGDIVELKENDLW